MAAVPFHYVDLRAFSYATEDERRVEAALRTLLPEEYPVDRAESEGHFGDRIVVLSTRVDNADDVRHVLDHLLEMDELDRVCDELDERVDEDCSLFVQLDKQRAYDGDVALGRGITLRAKVEAYPAKQPLAVENASEYLGCEEAGE